MRKRILDRNGHYLGDFNNNIVTGRCKNCKIEEAIVKIENGMMFVLLEKRWCPIGKISHIKNF